MEEEKFTDGFKGTGDMSAAGLARLKLMFTVQNFFEILTLFPKYTKTCHDSCHARGKKKWQGMRNLLENLRK